VSAIEVISIQVIHLAGPGEIRGVRRIVAYRVAVGSPDNSVQRANDGLTSILKRTEFRVARQTDTFCP
jgi:hypothetical protein